MVKEARERRKLKLLEKAANLHVARGWIAQQVAMMKEANDAKAGF